MSFGFTVLATLRMVLVTTRVELMVLEAGAVVGIVAVLDAVAVLDVLDAVPPLDAVAVLAVLDAVLDVVAVLGLTVLPVVGGTAW